MSHYTVLVLGDDIESALAPFDENMNVEPYKSYEKGEPKDFWAIRSLTESGHLDPINITWGTIAAAYNAKWSDDIEDGEDKQQVDEGGMYTMSTYNPASKWDWYSVGGRWSGYFLREDGRKVDTLLRKEWDLTTTRTDAENKYVKDRDSALAAIGDLPFTSWESVLDTIGTAQIDLARSTYHAQPSLIAYKASLGQDGIWADGDELVRYLDANQDRQIAMARASAAPGFGLLDLEGRWHEKGQMGWFGMSTADASSTIGYLEVANSIIDALHPDTRITLVDCHI